MAGKFKFDDSKPDPRECKGVLNSKGAPPGQAAAGTRIKVAGGSVKRRGRTADTDSAGGQSVETSRGPCFSLASGSGGAVG